MSKVNEYKNRIFNGGSVDKDDINDLYEADLAILCRAADEIRERMCGNEFDICTIVNAKSGRCPEDCKFYAQSMHYDTGVSEYQMTDVENIVISAKSNAENGMLRYSIVTSGKKINDSELDQVCDIIRAIKEEVDIEVCVSLGLLNENGFRKLKDAGATRAHCNLETSERFFPQVCTTHTYSEKLDAIEAARKAGLSVCSGGIIGLGETMQDRIDMAFAIRELDIKSIPVNFLNPISGTPLENNTLLTDDEKLRVIAIYRFILPDASIRLAGGRGLIADKGRQCFRSGANAAISGDMLTTSGITAETDIAMLNDLEYKIKLVL